MSRSEVLVGRGDVDAAQGLLMGTLMNRCGQVKAFIAVDFPDSANPRFCLSDLSSIWVNSRADRRKKR